MSENVTEQIFSPPLIKTLQWQWSIWLRLAAADRWQQRDLIILTAPGFSQHYIKPFYYCVWKKLTLPKQWTRFLLSANDTYFKKKMIKLRLNHVWFMKSCWTSGDQFSSSFSGNYRSFPVYIIFSGKSRLPECYKPIDQTGHSSLMLLFQSYDSQFLFNGTFNSWNSGDKNKGLLIETISKRQGWQDPTIFVARCWIVIFIRMKIKTHFVHWILSLFFFPRSVAVSVAVFQGCSQKCAWTRGDGNPTTELWKGSVLGNNKGTDQSNSVAGGDTCIAVIIVTSLFQTPLACCSACAKIKKIYNLHLTSVFMHLQHAAMSSHLCLEPRNISSQQ